MSSNKFVKITNSRAAIANQRQVTAGRQEAPAGLISEPIRVYMYSGKDLSLRRALIFCMMLRMSTDEEYQDKVQWMSLVSSYLATVWADTNKQMSTKPYRFDYEFVDFPSWFVAECRDFCKRVNEAETEHDLPLLSSLPNMYNQYDATTKEKNERVFPKMIYTHELKITIVEALAVDVLYAHFGLCAFLASKVIDENNKDAIIKRRPTAVIQKYGLKCVDTLTGDHKMKAGAWRAWEVMWREYNGLRAVFFTDIAKYFDQIPPRSLDIMLTNIRLMRLTGMKHYDMILQLMDRYESACTHPDFAPAWENFALDCARFEKVPNDIAPLYKLIKGDADSIFPRKELGPLLAAVKLSSAAQSMDNYVVSDNHLAIANVWWENEVQRAEDERVSKAAERKLVDHIDLIEDEAAEVHA